MKPKKDKKITDDLIGRDEKVCSCSVRIAELLGRQEEEKPSLAQTLDELRNKKDKPPTE